MFILPTLKSDSECYTEATPSLYGSDEDSDVEQDIGIEQVEEQDAGVQQVQEQDSRVVQAQVQGRVGGRGSAESDSSAHDTSYSI